MAASFDAPQYKLLFEKSNFAAEKSSHKYIVDKHFFNHGVRILVKPLVMILVRTLDIHSFLGDNEYVKLFTTCWRVSIMWLTA